MLPTSLPNASWLALAASLALAAPAAASGGLICAGEGVSADLATGSLPVLQVIGAYVEVGDRAWSTGPDRGEGIPIVVGQAFADGQQVLIDFTDPNIETILVSLRLRFGGSEDLPLSGTLMVENVAYPVQCGEG